jgi:hypothetical protein
MSSDESTKGALSRRTALAAGLAPLLVPRHVLGGSGYQAPSDKLAIACVGVGGMGKNYLAGCKSEAIVALCDVDHEFSAPVFKQYPSARLYKDFRQMFDKETKNFDALIVATPDHWHAHLALAALKMDKHLYCAKPITHTIAEARRVKAACLASKRTTKASIQDSRTSYARATTELLLTGAIGPIHEVHVWTGTYSPSGLARPDAQTPPEGMDWDEWCGPAPYRPYHRTYHYGNWRPWWDFGTGTVGDFGCHTLQMFHDELEMGTPDWVAGVGCQAFTLAGRVDNTECMSIANTVQWHIPTRGSRPMVRCPAAASCSSARRACRSRRFTAATLGCHSARSRGRASRCAVWPEDGCCLRNASRISSNRRPPWRAARSRITIPSGFACAKPVRSQLHRWNSLAG